MYPKFDPGCWPLYAISRALFDPNEKGKELQMPSCLPRVSLSGCFLEFLVPHELCGWG